MSLILDGDGSISGLNTITDIDNINIDQANITGVATIASLNATGVSTFAGNVHVADVIEHSGDSNTRIRFPAADTFSVETAGSERIRITSGGDVGLGTDNPKANSALHILRDTFFDITLQRVGAAPGICTIQNAGNQMRLSNNVDGIRFDTGNGNTTERLRITNSGLVGIGTDSPQNTVHVMGEVRISDANDVSQRLRISHDGIDFQNTGTGSSTTAVSHTLDDYERGAFTPFWTDRSATVAGRPSVNASYLLQQGTYTKVGRLVYFTAYFGIDATPYSYTNGAVNTNQAAIGGLPFTVANADDIGADNSNSNNYYAPYYCGFFTNFASWSTGYVPFGFTFTGATFWTIGFPDAGGNAYATNSNIHSGLTLPYIMISGHYYTDG